MDIIKVAFGIAVLTTALTGSAAACTDAPVLDRATLSAQDWDVASTVLQVGQADLQASMGEIRYAEYPVKDSKNPLRCIYAETSVTCSNGVAVCAMVLYVDEGGKQRIVLDAAVHKGEILPTMIDGWPDVALTAASSDGNVYYSVWRYRGDAYSEDSNVVKCSWATDQCPNE